jgi:hypothetical protein
MRVRRFSIALHILLNHRVYVSFDQSPLFEECGCFVGRCLRRQINALGVAQDRPVELFSLTQECHARARTLAIAPGEPVTPTKLVLDLPAIGPPDGELMGTEACVVSAISNAFDHRGGVKVTRFAAGNEPKSHLKILLVMISWYQS